MKKWLFKLFVAFHVWVYRMTGGRFGSEMRGFRVLLLTTTGRKSGKERTVALGYFEHDGGYVITASNAGQDRHPAWYFNLRSNPQVGIQVRDVKQTAKAEQAMGELRSQLWEELIEQASGYADYAKKTSREIPMVILRPTA